MEIIAFAAQQLVPFMLRHPLYSVSHQGTVQSNTIQQACAPLSEVYLAKQEFYFQTLFIHCQAKLTQPYNELTRQTGCKLYDFFISLYIVTAFLETVQKPRTLQSS